MPTRYPNPWPILFLLSFVLGTTLGAQPVPAKQLYPDLYDSFGILLFRYEVGLQPDEVLIVEEYAENADKSMSETETGISSTGPVSFSISLVDAGALHPSLQHTYMLRVGHAMLSKPIENVDLSYLANESDGTVALRFNRPNSNSVVISRRWRARVEKYAEAVKSWPNLAKPISSATLTSKRILRQRP